jgi:predicted DNA-binding antitoxin AbrB/MazE fold protein
MIVDAIYENGVLRPIQPLRLAERQNVRISIRPANNWVDATAGLLGWTGTSEELAGFAMDPEFDPQESA